MAGNTGNRLKEKPSKEQLYELYVNQQLSLKDIGIEMGIHRRTVSSYLEKYDIPKRSKKEAHIIRGNKQRDERYKNLTVEFLKEKLGQYMTVTDITMESGFPRKAIERKIEEGNLQELVLRNQREKKSERIKNNIHFGITEEKKKQMHKKRVETVREKARERWWNIDNFNFYAITARLQARRYYEKNEIVPSGMEIDHIFSIWDGWKNGIFVEDISHPNNLRLITEKKNRQKKHHSSISLEEFIKLVPNTRFFREKLKNTNCPVCDKEIILSPYHKRFCSRSCANKAREVHIDRTCVICNKAFVITKANSSKRTTCKHECELELRKINRQS